MGATLRGAQKAFGPNLGLWLTDTSTSIPYNHQLQSCVNTAPLSNAHVAPAPPKHYDRTIILWPGAEPDLFIWGGRWRGQFCNQGGVNGLCRTFKKRPEKFGGPGKIIGGQRPHLAPPSSAPDCDGTWRSDIVTEEVLALSMTSSFSPVFFRGKISVIWPI